MNNYRLNEKVFQFILGIFFMVLCLCFIIPFWMIFSISISNETDVILHGYKLFPQVVDWSAYKYLFEDAKTIVSAYKVTAISSIAGMLIHLVVTSMCAYTLSRQDFKFKSQVTFYLFFTMLFNGGLVPSYILMTQYLHVQNTYWALIIPLVSNVWHLFLMRTFFQQIPYSLVESAKIDGANDYYIYFKIILPLSTPALATIGLIQLLAGWNSWFNVLLYISDSNMYTLQYLLQVMLRNIQEIANNIMMNSGMQIDAEAAKELLEKVLQISEIFYKTKNVKPVRVKSLYPTEGEIVTYTV